MKKSIFVMAIATSLFLVSCGGAEKEKTAEGTPTEQESEEEEVAEVSIVGNWKMTGMDMGMEAPKGNEKEFQASIDEMVSKTSYKFNEDGTIDITSPFANVSGTYEYSNGTLKTKMQGREESIKVTSLTEEEMVFEIEDRGTTSSMTFKRG